MKEKTLGFIGLGNMGLPMSTALVEAGYEVYGTDLNKEAEKKLQEAGGKVGESIPDVAKKAEIIMTSLPSVDVVRDVFLGEDGIVKNATAGTLMIDFSTVSPATNVEVSKVAEEKGLGYLGVPVSGGIKGAKEKTLSIMAGGDKTLYDKASPLFEILGENVFYVGDKPEAGTIVKLINNLFIGFYTQAVGESLTLADHAGIDHQTLYDILSVSYGRSGIYDRNYKMFIEQENYNPGFTTKLLLKDLELAKKMAEENDVQLPIMEQLIPMYEKANEAGYADNDMSAMYLYVKDEIQKEAQKDK
ncbi:MAG TPA: NAD(P)-dependent oxidoreductase [Pseudogracilibacillus sp.]|nr:NAD(P)-dependent oxidoreductase [Pseudogracilibacillus sp.]